jgi:hypothetical protein
MKGLVSLFQLLIQARMSVSSSVTLDRRGDKA